MLDRKAARVVALLVLALALGACTASRQASVHAKQDRDALEPVTGSRIHNVDRKGQARTSSMVFIVDRHSARCMLQPNGC